jgi:tellurite resistance-related uncharacterized protein
MMALALFLDRPELEQPVPEPEKRRITNKETPMPQTDPTTNLAGLRQNALTKHEPYKTTPVFDENTLPAGLRKEHRTKAGVWGIIRVIQGRLKYRILNPLSETILDVDRPGYVTPEQPHLVEPMGAMHMVVEFYDQDPRHEKKDA